LDRKGHRFKLQIWKWRLITLFILLCGPHVDHSTVPRQLGFKAEACQSSSGSVLSLDEHANIGPYLQSQ